MGKIGKEQLEEDIRQYFASITEKPILYIEVVRMDKPMIQLSVENMIVLFLIDSYQMYEIFNIRPIFHLQKLTNTETSENFVMYESELFFQESVKTSDDEMAPIENNCKNPSIHLPQKKMHIAGLSAVLRFILRFAHNRQDRKDENEDFYLSLLGTGAGCLQACAESSIWTRFCEVDMIQMIQLLQTQLLKITTETTADTFNLPQDLLRLEYHLKRPVRVHNFLKWIQKDESKKTTGRRNKKAAPTPLPRDIPHDFAEGPKLSLSDFILFPCVDLAIVVLGMELFKKYLPLVHEWHQRLCGLVPFRPRVTFEQELLYPLKVQLMLEKFQVQVPEIPEESLYTNDPTRYNARWGLYTKQYEIENALKFLSSQGIQTLNFDDEKFPPFEWDKLPILVHPEGGKLPLKRIQKKSQQLSNLAQQVQKVYQDRYEEFQSNLKKVTIVDFCSGGGHLGILLANILPECEIILVENKEESLRRAADRVKLLNLENVSFFKCNLDYFIGSFEIGVALHACGTATDLVVTKCVEQKASFVVSPCCYGGIRSNHMLHYPRSLIFSRNFIDDDDISTATGGGPLTRKHYFVLSHAADQTHEGDFEKTPQGKVCMQMIDTDRCLHAQENNYQTSLWKMEPSTCSPKNHILVGNPHP